MKHFAVNCLYSGFLRWSSFRDSSQILIWVSARLGGFCLICVSFQSETDSFISFPQCLQRELGLGCLLQHSVLPRLLSTPTPAFLLFMCALVKHCKEAILLPKSCVRILCSYSYAGAWTCIKKMILDIYVPFKSSWLFHSLLTTFHTCVNDRLTLIAHLSVSWKALDNTALKNRVLQSHIKFAFLKCFLNVHGDVYKGKEELKSTGLICVCSIFQNKLAWLSRSWGSPAIRFSLSLLSLSFCPSVHNKHGSHFHTWNRKSWSISLKYKLNIPFLCTFPICFRNPLKS